MMPKILKRNIHISDCIEKMNNHIPERIPSFPNPIRPNVRSRVKPRYEKVYHNITWSISILAIIFVWATLAAFFFVQWAGKILFKSQASQINYGYGFGLIIPLCSIMSIIILGTIRSLYRSFFPLLHSLEKVAQGDYSVRITQPKNRFQGFMVPVNDTFNKMVTELQNTSILRTDFINSYSHEFKTPIVSINGFANLMLKQNVTEEERIKYLHIIADESSRLADLANSTLLLSKLDSQQIITDKKVYSLSEQLRQCVIMLSSSWEEKHITLNGDIDELSYNGNVELMQHLWLNLLTNAIKYTNDGGEISVSLKKDSTQKNVIIATISDNGCGMDEETSAHIFEKYYQGKTIQTGKGLGLGLSIVKRIVDLCGGTILVKSKVDEGTSFTVALPTENMTAQVTSEW